LQQFQIQNFQRLEIIGFPFKLGSLEGHESAETT
jgi:hypothetical protein